MIVLDKEHYRWFLLEEDGQLYLDAVCSHSVVDYLFLLKMGREEVAVFRDNGRFASTVLPAGSSPVRWARAEAHFPPARSLVTGAVVVSALDLNSPEVMTHAVATGPL